MQRVLYLLNLCLPVLFLLGTASCKEHGTKPAKPHTLAARLPADCNKAIQQFITLDQLHTIPDSGIRTFNRLAAKYSTTDTLAYATMRAYAAQGWDAKGEGDSIISACEDALAYFENKLPELDIRTMCHLYSGWGYYYKKNQLTANYFFSLAGNDLTDTIYLPEEQQYLTSTYPPATKAALLEEIAAAARISGLNEQAHHYILLSEQYVRRMPVPDAYLEGIIHLEAGTIYTRLQQYDSAAYMFRLVAPDAGQIKDPVLRQMYRQCMSTYYLNRGQYDSAIDLSLQYQAEARADTVANKNSEASQQLLTMVKAYTAQGNYKKAAGILEIVAPHLSDSAGVLADSRIEFLEAKAANVIAGHEGPEGYRLLGDYTKAKDQLYDQQRLAAITDMDARYKMRRREQAISRLNTDNEMYARRVRRQTKLLAISVLSALLLAAFVVIIYLRQSRRRLQASVDKMELEQRLLRSQIEPHFIFNTLAVLQGLIRREEKDRSIKYLNQFARLLRISLEHARESLVPLRGEVEAIGHYLSLQELRFQQAFTYNIDTWKDYEEESEDLLIPPMLLQPFAENALEHGMKGLTGRTGHIRITLEKEGKIIRCTIEDNGIGYDTSLPLAAGEKQSLATIITRERLAILGKKSGQPADLYIASTQGRGTTVTLCIPYLLNELKDYR